jgi:hypothetical protein
MVLFLPLLAVTGFPAGARAGQVTLAWDAVSGASGYHIYYGTESGRYGTEVDAGNVTTYTVTGLAASTTYYFAVTACSGTAESSYSGEASTTTAAESCTYAISPATKYFTASGGKGTVAVSTQSGCAWSVATGAAPWITISSGSSGAGSGTVGYRVYSNTSYYSRTAAWTIAARPSRSRRRGAR